MPTASCAWCSKLPPCTPCSIPTDQWQPVELRASLVWQLPSNSQRPTPCCVSYPLLCEFLVARSVAQQATGSVQFQFPRKTKQSNFLLLQFELVFLVHACNLALQLPLPFPWQFHIEDHTLLVISPGACFCLLQSDCHVQLFCQPFYHVVHFFLQNCFLPIYCFHSSNRMPAHSTLRPFSSSLPPWRGALNASILFISVLKVISLFALLLVLIVHSFNCCTFCIKLPF